MDSREAPQTELKKKRKGSEDQQSAGRQIVSGHREEKEGRSI